MKHKYLLYLINNYKMLKNEWLKNIKEKSLFSGVSPVEVHRPLQLPSHHPQVGSY